MAGEVLHHVAGDAVGPVKDDAAPLDQCEARPGGAGELADAAEGVLPRDGAMAHGRGALGEDGLDPVGGDPAQGSQDMGAGGGDADAGLGGVEDDVEADVDEPVVRGVGQRRPRLGADGDEDEPIDISLDRKSVV